MALAIGALVWLIGSLGLRIYLHYLNHYSATYGGSLGAVMILMLWLYVAGLAYLLGETIAEIQRAATRGR